MPQRPTNNSQSKQLNSTAPFPNREAPRTVPPCSFVPSGVNEVPSPANPKFPNRENPAQRKDLATVRADLKSFIRKNLLASPLFPKLYADVVISSAPNSNEAKILARNYQKIIKATMPSKSCTHIKVTGVACCSPALRGEQFCYFHQHAHR